MPKPQPRQATWALGVSVLPPLAHDGLARTAYGVPVLPPDIGYACHAKAAKNATCKNFCRLALFLQTTYM